MLRAVITEYLILDDRVVEDKILELLIDAVTKPTSEQALVVQLHIKGTRANKLYQTPGDARALCASWLVTAGLVEEADLAQLREMAPEETEPPPRGAERLHGRDPGSSTMCSGNARSIHKGPGSVRF